MTQQMSYMKLSVVTSLTDPTFVFDLEVYDRDTVEIELEGHARDIHVQCKRQARAFPHPFSHMALNSLECQSVRPESSA